MQASYATKTATRTKQAQNKAVTLTAEAHDSGKRLDSFVHERLPEYSRSRLQSWIKQDRVQVNAATARASHLLRPGDKVILEPAPLPPLNAEPEDLPLTILYQDDDVVVVDKPAGMVVHAGAAHFQGTLVNALLHHFGTLSTLNGDDLRPGIVHRLDRETSGVIAVARTDSAHQSLAEQFQSRTVEKVYLALAHGHFHRAEGRITAPISRDPVRRIRMTTKSEDGRSALTEYKTLEVFDRFTFLEVKIGTGRTHQIRVHLASLNHPIYGDTVYGAPAAPMNRFFLHAHKLSFDSPSTGERIAIESPLAPELAGFLASLRHNTVNMDVLK